MLSKPVKDQKLIIDCDAFAVTRMGSILVHKMQAHAVGVFSSPLRRPRECFDQGCDW